MGYWTIRAFAGKKGGLKRRKGDAITDGSCLICKLVAAVMVISTKKKGRRDTKVLMVRGEKT